MTDSSDFVIERITKADLEASAGNFVGAQEILRQVRDHATADEREWIKTKEGEIIQAQKNAAAPIQQELRELDREDSPDLEKAEELLEALGKVLGSDVTTVQYWFERFAIWQRNAESQAQVQVVTAEMEKLWKSGLLVDATTALRLAERYKAEQPEVIAWRRLFAEAERRRAEAATREEILLSNLMLGRFKELIEDFESRKAAGAKELDWFVLYQGHFVRSGSAPAQEAIDNLHRLAITYENDKAQEYLLLAQQELTPFPHAAYKRIKGALEQFHYMGDDWRQDLSRFLKDEAERAVTMREKVNKSLLEATEATKHPDPREAWRLINQLASQDPFAENIETAKRMARMRLAPALTTDLDAAEDWLRAGNYTNAQERAMKVRELISDDDSFAGIYERAQGLLERASQDKKLHDFVTREVTRIHVLAEHDILRADRELGIVEERIGRERLIEFPDLIALRQSIESSPKGMIEEASSELEMGYAPKWFAQGRERSPLIAAIALLTALASGILAIVFGEPRWLLGTVASAIFAVLAIAIASELGENA